MRQAGEHLSRLHAIAFFDLDAGDRQVGDLRADHHLVARDERAGHQDGGGQRALRGRDDVTAGGVASGGAAASSGGATSTATRLTTETRRKAMRFTDTWGGSRASTALGTDMGGFM